MEKDISGIAVLLLDATGITLSSFKVIHIYGNFICLDVPISYGSPNPKSFRKKCLSWND
jgi:hypothetical protein